MKKYEKPRFEPFKVGLSSGACGTGSSPSGNAQCREGLFASQNQCHGGAMAGKQCHTGSGPVKKCQTGTGDNP